MYELQGHGETALNGDFKDAIEKANVTLNSLNLMQADSIRKMHRHLLSMDRPLIFHPMMRQK